MKRLSSWLLVLAAMAVPLSARVVSYAPYTDRVATAGHHERTTQWFALLESEYEWGPAQVVLYDSTGAQEPRVVYPENGGSHYVSFVALYERKSSASPVNLPLLLIGVDGKLLFSGDAGATWKNVNGIATGSYQPPRDIDIGGPFVRGLGSSVLPGNDQYPFLISYNGVHAIDGSGTARTLFGGAGTRLIGRNAAGDQLLMETGSTIAVLTLSGGNTVVAQRDSRGTYSGWITANGSVYLQMLRPEGRFLFFRGPQGLQFIAGPYDTFPPPLGSPSTTLNTMRFFAVPTHDFEGAWMIQRENGKPTKLLRHRPNEGLKTFWVDEDGPQVEALIAGASGESLLVQVHRERDGIEQVPLLDPALAVWRVGHPAPSRYDELYLNESWDKGFVHVDVDKVANGDLFIFNSGTPQTFVPDVIISPAPGGGDVIQEWGVVRASLKQRLVLPGVARARGAFNSHWMTDVTIHNPLTVPQTIDVRFSSINEEVVAASAGSWRSITLEPDEIRMIPDVLQTLFGMEAGGGTLHFLPEDSVSVTGRTYSRRADGGTLGFGMQAVDFFNAVGSRFPMTFAGAFPGEHFRTNILLTDTSGYGSEAELKAMVIAGQSDENTMTITAPAGGTAQYNGVGRAGPEGAGLRMRPRRGTSIATVVAIDNRTNDATYYPPDRPAVIPRFIPIIGHLDGANGARFRSDLHLVNPADDTRLVILQARAWDSGLTKTMTMTLEPGEARLFPDALKTLFGMEGVARLRFESPQTTEGVRVTSRTYNVDSNGATYGCLIPPLNSFQIATTNESLEILGVHGGDVYRTNLGLVELGGTATGRVTIRIIDAAGHVLREISETVSPNGGKQVNNLDVGPGAARIVVDVHEGLIGAYATLTDNVTNDPTFLAAHLGAKAK